MTSSLVVDCPWMPVRPVETDRSQDGPGLRRRFRSAAALGGRTWPRGPASHCCGFPSQGVNQLLWFRQKALVAYTAIHGTRNRPVYKCPARMNRSTRDHPPFPMRSSCPSSSWPAGWHNRGQCREAQVFMRRARQAAIFSSLRLPAGGRIMPCKPRPWAGWRGSSRRRGLEGRFLARTSSSATTSSTAPCR